RIWAGRSVGFMGSPRTEGTTIASEGAGRRSSTAKVLYSKSIVAVLPIRVLVCRGPDVQRAFDTLTESGTDPDTRPTVSGTFWPSLASQAASAPGAGRQAIHNYCQYLCVPLVCQLGQTRPNSAQLGPTRLRSGSGERSALSEL